MPDSISRTCPQCGTPIPPQAPEGLCPRCVAALNLEGETAFAGTAESTVQTAPSEAELGPHFPQLEVLEYLGRGGMGVVYKARQRTLNRLVALKLLAPERVADAKFAARFAQEAKALATLSHPNIVTIYDFGQAGGFYYLLMEFVDGVNLRQAMKVGRFTPEQALSVVPPVCEGLQYAHEHGVVHRDIKPENLLLDREGRVKIADFGIAKMLDSDAGGLGAAESQPAGTPQYMAPEQRTKPERTGPRADIYSLGVVLYEMLTGEIPTATLQPPSRRVRVDVRIDEIVLRALEANPELRYATAADFRAQVEGVAARSACETERPVAGKESTFNPTTSRALAAVLFFAGLTIGAFLLDALHSQSGSAHVLMALAALLIALPLATTMMFRLRRKMVSGDAGESQQASAWLKLTAFLAFFGSVPALFFGVMFATGILNERGGWHPAPAEAVMVPLIVLGAVLLPISGGALWREAKRHEPVREPSGGFARVFRALLIALGVLLAVFACSLAIYFFQARSAPMVQVTCSASGVLKNAMFVDVHATPSAGKAAVWFGFEGPSLDSVVVATGSDLATNEKVEFLHPNNPGSVSPPRVFAGASTWRVMFLFPSETLAKEAQASFRPMGPLNLSSDRSHAGTLFELRAPNGDLYKASCFVSAPDRGRADYERMASWSSSGVHADPVKETGKPDAGAAELSNGLPKPPLSEGNTSAVSREFSLRHCLASQMQEDLRPILTNGGVEVSPSADNQQLTIKGPAVLVDRAATFIAVMDWPEPLRNAATGEYLSNSVLRAARSFFHACAVGESPATFSKLLSPHVLASLKGEAKSEPYENYMMGAVPDAQWEASLRSDWPGKEEAIRKFVASWNRYPLKRITEQPGIAMGFGVKHFCSVSFEGAPKKFYDVTIEPDRTKSRGGEEARFYFSSLPPWWEGKPSEAGEQPRTR